MPVSGTRISDFLAASIPFLIADGTSLALPTPKPTTPWPSPTTTSALKLRFLPPLTTLVTRLIDDDRVLQIELRRRRSFLVMRVLPYI